MKKIFTLLMVAVFALGTASGQSYLEKLGKKAVERAKSRTTYKVEQKVNQAVDKTFDAAADAVTGSGNNNNKSSEKKSSKEKTAVQGNTSFNSENNSNLKYDEWDIDEADNTFMANSGAAAYSSGGTGYSTGTVGSGGGAVGGAANVGQQNALEMTYSKSDFVAGDEIIFDDDVSSEQVGEFPSKWNLERGNAEVAMVNGEKVICLIGNDSWISPLMKEPKNYLSDIFTLEFDIMCPADHAGGSFELDFMQPDASRDNDTYTVTWSWYTYEIPLNYQWVNTNGERSNGAGPRYLFPDGNWHHIALSFNKRALKIYRDGKRVGNVPNVKAGAGWVTWWTGQGTEGKDKYMKNVRIAKGAVPLYDRMMSDGKFITYGITFDVGKSTIKPESMGEINRIVTMMNEKPELKFSVEGHTDNTGNAQSNQTLSEARSKAIVDKLVEMGVSSDRLTSSGKGQNNPIADNTTDEGRAKNRRVEFVKK